MEPSLVQFISQKESAEKNAFIQKKILKSSSPRKKKRSDARPRRLKAAFEEKRVGKQKKCPKTFGENTARLRGRVFAHPAGLSAKV